MVVTILSLPLPPAAPAEHEQTEAVMSPASMSDMDLLITFLMAISRISLYEEDLHLRNHLVKSAYFFLNQLLCYYKKEILNYSTHITVSTSLDDVLPGKV